MANIDDNARRRQTAERRRDLALQLRIGMFGGAPEIDSRHVRFAVSKKFSSPYVVPMCQASGGLFLRRSLGGLLATKLGDACSAGRVDLHLCRCRLRETKRYAARETMRYAAGETMR